MRRRESSAAYASSGPFLDLPAADEGPRGAGANGGRCGLGCNDQNVALREQYHARTRGLMTLGNDKVVLPAPLAHHVMDLTPFVQEIHLLKVFQRFEIPQRMHLIRSRLH
jgi:hypothetical protein